MRIAPQAEHIAGVLARMDPVACQHGQQFHAVFDAMAQAMAQTPQSSALVENLKSRLRNYFTLRRQLGGSYLGLLQFFLNRRGFLRTGVLSASAKVQPK